MANNKTYIGAALCDSATITRPAKAPIDGVQGIALTLEKDGVSVTKKGENAIGIALLSNDDEAKKGDSIDIQIKGIAKWVASAEIAEGDELAATAEGKAVKATSTDFIVGVALSAATKDGDIIDVQIVKAGYKPA